MKFNYKETEELSSNKSGSHEKLPTGLYDVRVLDAADGKTKSGSDCIIIYSFAVSVQDKEVVIEVSNKKTREKYGSYWISGNGYFFKRNIFALGLGDKYEEAANSQSGNGEIKASDIVGKSAKSVVVLNKTAKRDGDGFWENNKVVELVAPWDNPEERLSYWVAEEAKKEFPIASEVLPSQPLNDEIPF